MSGKGQSDGKRTNGDSQPEMVNLDSFLAEISERLATVSSIPVAGVQYDALVEPIERMQVVIFTMNDVHYAVDITCVSEVVRMPRITPVPGLPGWVLGVANLHGDVVSVIDLPSFLGVGAPADWRSASMIVAQTADQRIGLMVDDVDIIYTFPTEQVISPPFRVEESLVGYLRGTVEREGEFIRLLDCERLLLGQEMQQFS
jgi:purine-binding chemotaxis protein CheW